MVFEKRQKIEFKDKIALVSGIIVTVVGGIIVTSYQFFLTNTPKQEATEPNKMPQTQYVRQFGQDTNINLSELYELDEYEAAYIKDRDSSTYEFNVGTKTAGFYLTSLFNFQIGIKKNITIKDGQYLCDQYDMKSIELISGIPVHNPNIKQHSSVKSNFYNSRINDGFAHYNPELIVWAANNLIPDPKQSNIQGFMFQEIYDELYKKNFRLLVESYLYFKDEESYQAAQKNYLAAMKQKDFNGATYLFNKYPNNGCDFCFDKHVAIGFWIRRGIDGTNDEIWQAFTKVLKQYDSKWFRTAMKADKSLIIN